FLGGLFERLLGARSDCQLHTGAPQRHRASPPQTLARCANESLPASNSQLQHRILRSGKSSDEGLACWLLNRADKTITRNFRITGKQIMATVEWRVRADELVNCNCDFCCPCQFIALPTHRFCEAAVGYRIHEGHFGDVRLDGLNAALFVHWPSAIHEGNGKMQVVVDQRADTRQREALVKIMS